MVDQQRPSLIRKIRIEPPPTPPPPPTPVSLSPKKPQPQQPKIPLKDRTIVKFVREQYLNVISLCVILIFVIVLLVRYLKKKARLKQSKKENVYE